VGGGDEVEWRWCGGGGSEEGVRQGEVHGRKSRNTKNKTR
jgi:hypothetical protein